MNYQTHLVFQFLECTDVNVQEIDPNQRLLSILADKAIAAGCLRKPEGS